MISLKICSQRYFRGEGGRRSGPGFRVIERLTLFILVTSNAHPLSTNKHRACYTEVKDGKSSMLKGIGLRLLFVPLSMLFLSLMCDGFCLSSL